MISCYLLPFPYSMILSLVVYSDKSVISGDIIAGLINENKETFDMTFSDAVAG